MARKVKKNNYGLIAIVLGLALVSVLSVQVVRADNVQSSASDLVEIIKAGSGNEAIILGAFDVLRQSGLAIGAAPSDIASGFWDMYVENDLTVDGDTIFNGTVSGNATTTQSVNTYFPINVVLDLTGTSTIKGATQNVVAYYTNTGADKIITWAGLDFQVKNNIFATSYQCGTSTWVGGVEGGSLVATSTQGVVASTTVATTFTTENSATVGVIDSHGYPGDAISDKHFVFPLANNEVFFCTRTIWAQGSATSSGSFDTDTGGYTAAGRMFGNLWARNN